MKKRAIFIFKVIVMGFALYGAIRGMVYFRSPEFITSVATMMGAMPPPPETPLSQSLSWCENAKRPEFFIDGNALSAQTLCELKIESYDNSLLKNAKFSSKIEAKSPGAETSLIEADLQLGLFKYKDIIFSSQQLSSELKNPSPQNN